MMTREEMLRGINFMGLDLWCDFSALIEAYKCDMDFWNGLMESFHREGDAANPGHSDRVAATRASFDRLTAMTKEAVYAGD